MRWLQVLLISMSVCLAVAAQTETVNAYEKDVEIQVGTTTVSQHRWYLENDYLLVGVISDPGGAVVEFVSKETGTNHATGPNYSVTTDGETRKSHVWGWKDTIRDYPYDPLEKQMAWQPYEVEFQDGDDGAKILQVTGRTAEQQVVRRHILAPGSRELRVDITLTNITDRPRRLWLRWHPYSYVSANKFGDSGCVLSPGEGDQVRKMRVGWGWDHWFRTYDGYWLGADFKNGEGLFMTFEKEKVPIHFTWSSYGKRNEKKGAITFEPFPEVLLKEPGESISSSFAYSPFSAETAPDEIPLGVLTDDAERDRARAFLRRVKPLENLRLFGAHTFARTLQFDWNHRRRDKMGIRDWGFADCAIVGFPFQHKSIQCRMVGGVFDTAAEVDKFPASYPMINFTTTITSQDGLQVYRGSEGYLPAIGVPGENTFDHEISIPMDGLADGTYTLKVEVIDPITRKPFHQHETDIVVFGDRIEAARQTFAEELAETQQERPFVTALAALDEVAVEAGVARIPIGVEDGSNSQRKGFPVRLGVPFPQGALSQDSPARLLDPAGEPVPAQFRVMNVWPDQSLKWLQVDFQAACAANGFAFYTLETGPGVAAQPAGDNLVAETEDGLVIDTGPLQLRIDRTRPGLPGDVFLDRNGDGVFEPSEQVVLASRPEDLWWQDGEEQYHLQLAGEAGHLFNPGVSIEQNGALSAVVKLEGWYTNAAGERPAYGEIRVEVYKGKAHYRLWHQVTFTGSPWHNRLSSYGVNLRVPPDLYQETFYEADGKSFRATGASSLYQRSDDRALITGGGEWAAERASGALHMKGLQGSLLVYHPNLWQMYPKKLTADPQSGQIGVHYWPREAGEHNFEPYEEYWIPSSSSAEACGTGASRTDELVVDFSNLLAVTDAEAVYNEPVVACTPPQWVSDTKALGKLSPYDADAHPEVETYIREVIDYYDRNREFYKFYGHWDYGTHHNVYQDRLYRWLVIGRYANIGNEENILRAPWLAWYRSGDRRYLKFAKLWTRHLMEVQSIRWHDNYPEFIGMSRRHHYTTWLGAGDWGHTMLDPWLEYYHATGYYPAWQMARQTAKAMANTYSGSWRYISNPIIGNTRMYLETGDDQYKEVADRIWRELCAPDRNTWFTSSHGARLARWYSLINPDVVTYWETWSKEGRDVNGKPNLEFPYVDSYGELAERTGDDWFAHQARLGFIGFRNTYTGQLAGTHPLYRGRVPTITQYTMGKVREVAIAADAIARSEALIPARYYGLRNVRQIIIREQQDGPVTIWTSNAGTTVTGPDGKGIEVVETLLVAGKTGKATVQLFEITIPADGQTGDYLLGPGNVSFFGCSLPQVAFRLNGNTELAGDGAPLYLRSDEVTSGGVTRFLLGSAPGASIELSSLDGTILCSETHVRPHSDAIAVQHEAVLPRNQTLKLGDRVGVRFHEQDELILYLNPEGVFTVD